MAVGAVVAFIAAFIIYFANTFIVAEREYAVYSSMEEPTLPVIYAEVNNREINPMHGYLQDMGNAAASDCITPLPEDRRLKLKIRLSGGIISAIRYEIRSLDLQHFIEKTELNDFDGAVSGETVVSLPIQNMIEKDKPYLLKLQLDIGEKEVNYYTKIIWTDSSNIYSMIETAADFTSKSFDYNKARDLTVYLETDPNADTNTLSTVGLTSGFSQITWGSTDMRLSSDLNISVREYDGIMGAVEISYLSESSEGSQAADRYYNRDEFTMRAGTERIYMMNFERKTNQIFEGNKHLFDGKKIELGIINPEDIQTALSENGNYTAFKAGKELWLYDRTKKSATNIFSFRSESDYIRAGYDKHDIKILSVDDAGNVDFAVYGYMNRGRHEGINGIVYYNYQRETNNISELVFIPRVSTYERIKEEADELLTKAETGMLYLKQEDAVTAVDLTSLEALDVVSDIYGSRYAVSDDQTKLTWVDGESGSQNSIKLMDLSTGTTRVISAEDGETLSVIDFYDQDLIYGISRVGTEWRINGRLCGRPIETIKIVDAELSEIMTYRRDGLYFEDVTVEGDRIQISQYKMTDENTYQFAGKDTIVSSKAVGDIGRLRVSGEIDEIKRRCLYIELDEEIKSSRSVDINVPNSISYEKAGEIELMQHKSSAATEYYVYANGRLIGTEYTLRRAIDACYDSKGWVEDSNAAVLYSRCDRVGFITLKDPVNAAQPLMMALEGGFTVDTLTDDGYMVMNAQGLAVNKILYYVSKGYPVLAFTEGGAYCLIYGYNAESVQLYYPSGNDTEAAAGSREMSMDDAALYFDRYKNDFIVFTKYPGN